MTWSRDKKSKTTGRKKNHSTQSIGDKEKTARLIRYGRGSPRTKFFIHWEEGLNIIKTEAPGRRLLWLSSSDLWKGKEESYQAVVITLLP